LKKLISGLEKFLATAASHNIKMVILGEYKEAAFSHYQKSMKCLKEYSEIIF